MFWEDYYIKHPTDAKRTSDGKEVQFVTGDPIIDKWEAEIAQGLVPDLTEGMSELDRKKAREDTNTQEQLQEIVELSEGFSETF